MRFTVGPPPRGLSGQLEEGPQEACWQGDEMCAFVRGGSCTQVPCTCETTGVCLACPPRAAIHNRTSIARIP